MCQALCYILCYLIKTYIFKASIIIFSSITDSPEIQCKIVLHQSLYFNQCVYHLLIEVGLTHSISTHYLQFNQQGLWKKISFFQPTQVNPLPNIILCNISYYLLIVHFNQIIAIIRSIYFIVGSFKKYTCYSTFELSLILLFLLSTSEWLKFAMKNNMGPVNILQ